MNHYSYRFCNELLSPSYNPYNFSTILTDDLLQNAFRFVIQLYWQTNHIFNYSFTFDFNMRLSHSFLSLHTLMQ